MIIGLIIILSVSFFIAVWFYKQRRENIEILQLEFSNLLALNELVDEQQPIVIRSAPFPTSLTAARLQQIPRLDNFILSGTLQLADYRLHASETPDGVPILSPESAIVLTKELALDTWVSFTLADFLNEFNGYMSFMNSKRTLCVLGGVGMIRPAALYTCILPTDGTYTVSLVAKRSESFLPHNWKGRYPSSITVNDTPLVGEIQFIDIVLRPGTILAIPRHCIYSLQPKTREFHSAVVIEIHSPISTLAAVLDGAA